MSHVTEMEADVDPKKINDFIEALKEHFGEDGVEVHLDKPVILKSWQDDDLTKGGSYGKAPACHIVVRQAIQTRKAGRQLLVNDLGYCIKDGKVVGYVDVAGFTKADQDNVIMDYAGKVTVKQLKKQNYSVKAVKENGVVKIKAGRYM